MTTRMAAMAAAMATRWVLIAALGGAGCQKGSSATAPAAGAQTPSVAATVNGVPITGEELDKAAAAQLKPVESQIYQIKKGVLDDLIEDRLIAAAAQQAGKSAADFLTAEVTSKVSDPTEADCKQFYEQRKAQMGDRAFDDVKGQIRQYLNQSRTQAARQELVGRLRAGADVAIALAPPRANIEAGDNPARGPKGAPVQIVEWTDYQCPYCSRSRPTVNQILATYGDRVRYVLRDFPLSFHQNSFKAHEAAHCAGDQGKYWEMNQKLFGAQQELAVPKLKEYARQLKLDGGKFDKCLESSKYKDKVQKNQEAGSAAGVTGTPSFFINGINISGARPFTDFKDIIDRELAKR